MEKAYIGCMRLLINPMNNHHIKPNVHYDISCSHQLIMQKDRVGENAKSHIRHNILIM